MTRILCALAALLLTGCEVGRVVWLIGDSIASLEIEELHGAATLPAWVDGAPKAPAGDLIIPVAAVPGAALGRDLQGFLRRIGSVRARGIPADAVVISLGTNDIGPPLGGPEPFPLVDTQDELGAAIDALLGSLPDVPVIWILPASPGSLQDRVGYVRSELASATQRWPKLSLITPEPEWYVGGDGIHLSTDGTIAAARAVVDRLDVLLPQAQP